MAQPSAHLQARLHPLVQQPAVSGPAVTMASVPIATSGVNTTSAAAQPTPMVTSQPQAAAASDSRPMTTGTVQDKVLDRQRLQELVKEVDPLEQLDEEVEEMMMQIADDFIDNVVTAACQIARHRKANTVEVKDVQLHLERNWNMWVPGFGSEDLKPYKKAATTEAHKQRMALIKKTLKKY